mmetsp:Transcript_15471/g.15587  ORF Transcript_15471/g.15587 Transcript_15471/m.15587 type:complete len:188 (-) Transcript_15471:12-575(-)
MYHQKKIHGINGRYAGAVYTAASKAGMLTKVEEELSAFQITLKKSSGFASFLENPSIPRGEKTAKVGDIFGEKFSHITKNLFTTMAANGKINDASKVVDAYMELMEASRGVVKVVITAAEPLSNQHLSSLKTAISDMVGKGKTVDLEVKEDKNLIGGLTVMIGDTFLDLSVSNRIQDYNAMLESSHL